MTSRTATLIGLTAILMWSLLTVFTVTTGRIPAFQLAAMTFAIGGLVGCASWLVRPGGVASLRQPLVAWVVGVGGLFGFHALYFLALRLAPPAEAGLLNYLWPLLIVLFSSLLPGERLAPHHIIGALLGLVGTVLLFAGNTGTHYEATQIPGFIAAFTAALVWTAYSVLSRKLKAVPTDAVAGFCLATALLAATVHFSIERTVWPETPAQWLAIVALGIGPVGAAFYACAIIPVKSRSRTAPSRRRASSSGVSMPAACNRLLNARRAVSTVCPEKELAVLTPRPAPQVAPPDDNGSHAARCLRATAHRR